MIYMETQFSAAEWGGFWTLLFGQAPGKSNLGFELALTIALATSVRYGEKWWSRWMGRFAISI